MKFVIQVVSKGEVKVDGQVTGSIGRGYVVLIGVGKGDTKAVADKMIDKMIGLRIFPDENGKTNLNLETVGGALLLISQFTLYADCRHGHRPGFTDAEKPAEAEAMYEYVIEACKAKGVKVERGVFGAHMELSLVNEGPFTILLDSKEL